MARFFGWKKHPLFPFSMLETPQPNLEPLQPLILGWHPEMDDCFLCLPSTSCYMLATYVSLSYPQRSSTIYVEYWVNPKWVSWITVTSVVCHEIYRYQSLVCLWVLWLCWGRRLVHGLLALCWPPPLYKCMIDIITSAYCSYMFKAIITIISSSNIVNNIKINII